MPRHLCTPFSVHPLQTLHPALPHPSHQSRQEEDSRDTKGLPHAKSLPCTVPSPAFPMPAPSSLCTSPARVGHSSGAGAGQFQPAWKHEYMDTAVFFAAVSGQ